MKGGEAVDKPLRLTQSAFEDATDRKKMRRQQKIFAPSTKKSYLCLHTIVALRNSVSADRTDLTERIPPLRRR